MERTFSRFELSSENTKGGVICIEIVFKKRKMTQSQSRTLWDAGGEVVRAAPPQLQKSVKVCPDKLNSLIEPRKEDLVIWIRTKDSNEVLLFWVPAHQNYRLMLTENSLGLDREPSGTPRLVLTHMNRICLCELLSIRGLSGLVLVPRGPAPPRMT